MFEEEKLKKILCLFFCSVLLSDKLIYRCKEFASWCTIRIQCCTARLCCMKNVNSLVKVLSHWIRPKRHCTALYGAVPRRNARDFPKGTSCAATCHIIHSRNWYTVRDPKNKVKQEIWEEAVSPHCCTEICMERSTIE